MTTPVLELRDIVVRFGGGGGLFRPSAPAIRAVDGASLVIQPGETLALVGESGCGKSTLSNVVVGLQAPSSGSVRLLGQEIAGAGPAQLREMRRHVQMVFQDPALSLNPRARIGAAIAEPLIVHGLASGAALRQRVAALLAQVGLSEAYATRFPHQLSGGQRQRVGIARALALEPALLVCDEPVSALDVSVRAQILNLLVDLQARLGMASLFVSHDLAVVRHVCDRVAVMYLGRIVETAPRDLFFAGPRHPYAQALLSAVKLADPAAQRQRQRIVLAGEPPSPAARPSGCAFHQRCKVASTICTTDQPELIARADGSAVACHHA